MFVVEKILDGLCGLPPQEHCRRHPQRVTPRQFISEGRTYGGGLPRWSPKNWRRFLPAMCLRVSTVRCEIEQQDELFA